MHETTEIKLKRHTFIVVCICVAFFSAVFSVVAMFFTGLTSRVFFFIVYINIYSRSRFCNSEKIIILVGRLSTRGEPSLRQKVAEVRKMIVRLESREREREKWYANGQVNGWQRAYRTYSNRH